ncbi:MAG: PIN domain-containing protein [Candidatus Thiodiazotropha sp.]
MIILDTGPLIALFDPKDPDHQYCHAELRNINEALYTTEAVLTEAFHLLDPGSRGAEGLMQFVIEDYVSVVPLDKESTVRAFELMNKYADCPMDYADASIIVIAEVLNTLSVFTLDVRDFSSYRIKKGHRYYSPKIIGQ